jgi:hypothetical protein
LALMKTQNETFIGVIETTALVPPLCESAPFHLVFVMP